MITGEIYYWITNRALGHDARPKYHVYLSEADWHEEGYAFLFINKSNNYGGDYEIQKADYEFFTLPYSYISCGDLVFYTDADLALCSPELKGRVANSHLAELYHAILASETMVEWKIRLACQALKDFL